MLTAEEILAQMSNTKFFTKLDASNEYWKIPVNDKSSKLLTFNSPNGCYCFLSMLYGIHSANDVCQNRISQLLDNIEGATNSQDDIIIWGETLEELKNRTIKVFMSIRNQGLEFNKKWLFNKSEVVFKEIELQGKVYFQTNEKLKQSPTCHILQIPKSYKDF